MTDRHTVLLVGCGNIGFRHLQALSTMSTPTEIFVVEPNDAVHGRIRSHFADAEPTEHRFQLSTSLPQGIGRFELVVVATTAAHRSAAVHAILERYGVRSMILEKVLFQTVGELESVGSALAGAGVTAFVNCGRRTFPGYREIRDGGCAARPLSIAVDGHRLGLASNAIHFLDLLEYLNDEPLDVVDLDGLVPGAVAGRRADCVEIYGTVVATATNGAQLRLVSLDEDPVRIEVSVTDASGTTVHIDELSRTITGADGDVRPFASQNVSETPEIYQNALESSTCDLTPYDDSVRQHRLFIEALRAHLGLSNAEDVPCPIS